ncbi:hypothetical protein HK105_201394 [Polyrhizophydium stewartii]|uniref:Uncharacterized protein n=1 Tax=Polyrhizophydium stewartii TaxID=2732419 RepID=A0ABR4NHZ1_9FUNG|nr:hypothetical protein HK105_001039 [Polyrhizophydium stewartii]
MARESLFRQSTTEPDWGVHKIPSLAGRVAIVTGASAGLGKVTALELARKGAHVFLVGRSEAKTQAVVDEIKRETGSSKVELLLADLLDLQTVEAAADKFVARGLPLDILVNNAGIMDAPFALSAQGIESTFAVNHFATTVFTVRLLPAIKRAAMPRIVNVSSYAHEFVGPHGIDFAKLNDEASFDTNARYCETKLANVLFTTQLQKHFEAAGVKNVLVNAVHPGVVETELFRHNDVLTPAAIADQLLKGGKPISAEKGALTQLYVAADPEVAEKQYRGRYFVPFAQLAEVHETAKDEGLAARTWEWAQDVLQKHYRADWSWAAADL